MKSKASGINALHIMMALLLAAAFRYNESLELEDAIHTAILTLKVRLLQNTQIVPFFCILC